MIDPPSLDLVELDRATLSATAFNKADEAIPSVPVAWRSSNPTVASVSPLGEVSAGRGGTATISATIDGVVGEAEVSVEAGVVVGVIISGAPEAMVVGDSFFLSARAVDAQDRTLGGRSPSWTSSNPGVASVDEFGALTALAAGTATITAEVEGIQAQVIVEVAAPPALGRVAMGYAHTCWLDATGSAWCWGSNESGQLGDGTYDDHEQPAPAATGLTFISLMAGEAVTCGVTDTNQVYCWGGNYSSELGEFDDIDSAVPVLVAAGPYAFVGGMYGSLCAIRPDGHPECWGYNSLDHELGIPSTDDSPVPVPVTPPQGVTSMDLVDLKGGVYHACGLSQDSRLFCWGYNAYGQVGVGNTNRLPGPVEIFPGQSVSAFGMGSATTCATADGVSYCWGDGWAGQLGTGDFDELASPTAVLSNGVAFTDFAGGDEHMCGLDEAGHAWCWGTNYSGQLGTGTDDDSEVPVQVAGDLVFTSISARSASTCAVAIDGALYCWGANYVFSWIWGIVYTGQLGIPGVDEVFVPTPVQW